MDFNFVPGFILLLLPLKHTISKSWEVRVNNWLFYNTHFSFTIFYSSFICVWKGFICKETTPPAPTPSRCQLISHFFKIIFILFQHGVLYVTAPQWLDIQSLLVFSYFVSSQRAELLSKKQQKGSKEKLLSVIHVL